MPRHVSYRSLLLTGRAVRKKGPHVVYSTAGDNPIVLRLTCSSGSAARQLAGYMAMELRKARSDTEYNQTIARILDEIKRAWPVDVRYQHVHECDRSVPGKTNKETGLCDCGFDWTKHELTLDCRCGVAVDESRDVDKQWVFVVHRNTEGMKKGRAIIT